MRRARREHFRINEFFARPHARRVDDVFRDDTALFRFHLPFAIGSRGNSRDRCVPKDLRAAVARVQKLAPESQARYRQQLIERIKAAGLPAPAADDERLIKEVVYFADRSDITEELTRLESHFKQFADCLKTAEPVGRTLDFLAQEMNREINTIGSKANDAGIAHTIVEAKTELEKIREQVQNVE